MLDDDGDEMTHDTSLPDTPLSKCDRAHLLATSFTTSWGKNLNRHFRILKNILEKKELVHAQEQENKVGWSSQFYS